MGQEKKKQDVIDKQAHEREEKIKHFYEKTIGESKDLTD